MTGNAAFDAALAAGGAIDTSVGVPKTREEMFEFYGFIRDQANDAESKKGEGGPGAEKGGEKRGGLASMEG